MLGACDEAAAMERQAEAFYRWAAAQTADAATRKQAVLDKYL